MSDGSTSASVDLWIDIFSPTSGPRVAGPGLRSPIKRDYVYSFSDYSECRTMSSSSNKGARRIVSTGSHANYF